MENINAWNHGRSIEAYFKPLLEEYYYKKEYARVRSIDSILLQRLYDVDRVVDGNSTEDKYALDRHNNRMFIEEYQNSHIKSKGWIYTCKAKWLNYIWCDPLAKTLHINLFDFERFKNWYLIKQDGFTKHCAADFSTAPIGRFIDPIWVPRNCIIDVKKIKYFSTI